MRQREFVILLCPVFTVKQNLFFLKVTALSLPIACNPAGHIERLSFQLIAYDFFFYGPGFYNILRKAACICRERSTCRSLEKYWDWKTNSMVFLF